MALCLLPLPAAFDLFRTGDSDSDSEEEVALTEGALSKLLVGEGGENRLLAGRTRVLMVGVAATGGVGDVGRLSFMTLEEGPVGGGPMLLFLRLTAICCCCSAFFLSTTAWLACGGQ